MNLKEIESLMEREHYVDTMGGRVTLDEVKNEATMEIEMNLRFRDVSTMLIYLEKQPDSSYRIRTYIPRTDFVKGMHEDEEPLGADYYKWLDNTRIMRGPRK